MQLEFERWLVTQSLTEDALGLFKEAVVCFKASAYRAALLMSYLGFQSTVRNRILSAAVPTGVPAGKWTNIQTNLRNDSEWDSTTFDAIQTKTPAPIFIIADDLRVQVTYWKDRRNDCAHSKRNHIGASHVEAFMLFVQSNLAKFVVNGSAQSLLAKLDRHFDPTYTAPGTDVAPLAAEVSSAIEPRDLPDFFQKVTTQFTTPVGMVRGELFAFFEGVLSERDVNVQNALIAFLAANEGLMVSFLRFAPHRLMLLSANAALVRRLWTTHLFVGTADYPLYAGLLRNNLIPAADLTIVNTTLIPRLAGGIPEVEHVDELRRGGFFSAFEQYAFVEDMVDKFKWGNPNAELVCWYLERFPISDEAIRTISSYFDSEPTAHAARDALNALFDRSAAKRAEFKAGAERLGCELPSLLTALAKP